MDYVACAFDELDICFGEEALDLWVVFGAAGQGKTASEVWSKVHPDAFLHLLQAESQV